MVVVADSGRQWWVMVMVVLQELQKAVQKLLGIYRRME